MGVRQAVIQFYCFHCQPLGFATALFGRDETPPAEHREAIGQTGVCSGIRRIFGNRLLEALHSFSESLSVAPLPMVTAPKIGLVCFRIDGTDPGDMCPLLRG